jgi:hypothetical protein
VIGQLLRCLLAGVVPIVGDQHALDVMLFERAQVIGGKSLHPITGSHIPIAHTPERQRIDQRFAEDYFLHRAQRRCIPHTPVRTGQVQVFGCAGAQMFIQLATVDFRHFSVANDDWDDERAVKMLVAALAQDPDALQRSAQGRAFHPGFLRQSIAQGAIGHAELEGADRFLGSCPAPLQVFKRFRILGFRSSV